MTEFLKPYLVMWHWFGWWWIPIIVAVGLFVVAIYYRYVGDRFID